MLEDKNVVAHNIVMEKCRQISMTGINEVKTFDEETVVLDTSEGTLTIKGEGLVINGFSATTGDLSVQGEIWALVYSKNNSKGFLRRVLK